jgi:hypothetical protein
MRHRTSAHFEADAAQGIYRHHMHYFALCLDARNVEAFEMVTDFGPHSYKVQFL